MVRLWRLIAGMAALGFPAAAHAQSADSANASGKAVLLSPLNFINDTNLHFGAVILPTGVAGTITINPDPAAPVMTSTGVIPIASSNPTRGRMIGAGSRRTPVLVSTAFPTRLYLNGVTTSPQSLPVSLRLDRTQLTPNTFVYNLGLAGVFSVHVGGTLTIPANTAPGTYSAIYTVTATYL